MQPPLLERLERLGRKLGIWLFLVVVGVCAACLSLGTDLVISWLHGARAQVLARSGECPLVGRCLWTVSLALVAHGCARASPQCAGSGIPELKLLLSCSPSPWAADFFSWRTLACKLVGIACVTGAGLSVGREGPFVHITCCVAFLLAPQRLRASPRHLATVLRAAAAAGVAFTFGAPIGGLLFAAEVSVTFFRVSHLPRALACALSGLLAVTWLDYGSLAPFKAKAVEPAHALSPGHTAATIGLGVACAALAAGFNRLLRRLLALREARLGSGRAQLLAVLGVSLLTALLSAAGGAECPSRMLGLPNAQLLPALVGRGRGAGKAAATGAPVPPFGELGALSWLGIGVAKLLLTACTIVLPLPCGLFIPTFISGALVGRAWSELLVARTALVVTPGAYALIGAAALTASVTGTISTSVIALELTGLSAGEASPLALACVVSIALRGLAVPSVYDVIGERKRLPGHALLMATRGLWARSGALGRGGESGCSGSADGAFGFGGAEAPADASAGGSPPARARDLTAGDMAAHFDCGGALPRLQALSSLGALRDAASESVARGLPLVPVVGARGASGQQLLGVVPAARLQRYASAQLQAERGAARPGPTSRALSPPRQPQRSSASSSASAGAGASLEEGLLDSSERAAEREVDLRFARAPPRGAELLERAPFVVPAQLSLPHLVQLFQMLELGQCFVLAESGGYLGTLTREGLSAMLSQLDAVAASRRPLLSAADWGGQSAELAPVPGRLAAGEMT